MHPAAPEHLALWIQYVFVFAGGLAVFVGTLFGYIKKGGNKHAQSNDVAVVSATFADRRTIEHLTDSMDRLERALHDSCEEERRTRLSIESNTDAQLNLLRFMKGRLE